jgi:hypothetical protein
MTPHQKNLLKSMGLSMKKIFTLIILSTVFLSNDVLANDPPQAPLRPQAVSNLKPADVIKGAKDTYKAGSKRASDYLNSSGAAKIYTPNLSNADKIDSNRGALAGATKQVDAFTGSRVGSSSGSSRGGGKKIKWEDLSPEQQKLFVGMQEYQNQKQVAEQQKFQQQKQQRNKYRFAPRKRVTNGGFRSNF